MSIMAEIEFDVFDLALIPSEMAERQLPVPSGGYQPSTEHTLVLVHDDWEKQKRCNLLQHPEKVMFPTNAKQVPAAKMVCGRCVVLADCKEDLFRTVSVSKVAGFRAGMSERQQRVYITKRKKQEKVLKIAQGFLDLYCSPGFTQQIIDIQC